MNLKNKPQNFFSLNRVKNNFKHFVIGRAFSSILAFVVALVIIRELEVVDYAYYTTLTGLLIVLMFLGSLGVDRAVPKFISESMEHGLLLKARNLVLFFSLVRVALLLFTILISYFSFDFFSNLLNFSISKEAFNFFLWYLFFFGLTMHTQRSLQALLLNKIAMIGVSLDWFIRLSILFYFITTGGIDLSKIFQMQAIGAFVGFVFCFFYLAKFICRRELKIVKSRFNSRRMLSYSLTNYFQGLAGFYLQPAMGKVIASSLLLTNNVALLGFAYAITGVLKRYLPVNLFMGLIEPVIMGRYGKSKNYDEVLNITSLMLKLNAFIILPIMVWMLLSAAPVLDLVSNGKYSDGGWLVSSLLFLLVLESQRNVIQLVCNAVDKSYLLLTSNLFALVFLLPFLVLTFLYGLEVMIVGLICIYIFRNVYIQRALIKKGFEYATDWIGFFKILIFAIFANTVGYYVAVALFESSIMSSVVAAFTTGIVFLLVSYYIKPFRADESKELNKLLGKNIFVW